MVKTVITLITYLGLLGFIGLICVVALLVIEAIFKPGIKDRILDRVAPHSYILAFVFALVATMSSLFLSEVAHFQPCILCWYQRITMYPQTVLYYIALMRREKVLRPYGIVLNIIGGIVALYHYSLHVLPHSIEILAPCSKAYAGVPCDKGYTKFFGFMTYPLMAWVVFMWIIIMLVISTHRTREVVPVKPARTKKRAR